MSEIAVDASRKSGTPLRPLQSSMKCQKNSSALVKAEKRSREVAGGIATSPPCIPSGIATAEPEVLSTQQRGVSDLVYSLDSGRELRAMSARNRA